VNKPKVKASTMSVISKDSTSVSCFLEVGGESANITLRFDRGEVAQICGYPMDWGIHDVNIDYYDSESPTFADLKEADGLEEGTVYVSPETEVLILKKLKRSVERQFEDCSWMDHELSLEFQLSILNKINAAVERLENGGDRE
jgi:hypothetical protein